MTGVNGDIQITTLVENVVYGKGLQGEHGLSLLVEVRDRKVLFDTGASDLFIRNARLMGIDLREVDYLVLSHGHRDHTGGLHHLVNSTVAARQKVRTKVARHLIDYICLPVAQQLLVVARIGHKFVHAVFSLKVSNRLR